MLAVGSSMVVSWGVVVWMVNRVFVFGWKWDFRRLTQLPISEQTHPKNRFWGLTVTVMATATRQSKGVLISSIRFSTEYVRVLEESLCKPDQANRFRHSAVLRGFANVVTPQPCAFGPLRFCFLMTMESTDVDCSSLRPCRDVLFLRQEAKNRYGCHRSFWFFVERTTDTRDLVKIP